MPDLAAYLTALGINVLYGNGYPLTPDEGRLVAAAADEIRRLRAELAEARKGEG